MNETNNTPLVLKVLRDENPLNPRTDWDNMDRLDRRSCTLMTENHLRG